MHIPQKFSAKLLHYKRWPLTLQKLVKVKFHEAGVPLLIFRMVLMLPCKNIQLQENSKLFQKTSKLLQNMLEHFQTKCVACEANLQNVNWAKRLSFKMLNFPFEIFLCNVLFYCKTCHSSTQSRQNIGLSVSTICKLVVKLFCT